VIARGDNACIDSGFIEVIFNEPMLSLTNIMNACDELLNGSIVISTASDLRLPFVLTDVNEGDIMVEEIPFVISDLAAGDYFIIAEDAQGCTTQSSFIIGDERNDDLMITATQISGGQFQLALNSSSSIDQVTWNSSSTLSCNDCNNPIVNINQPTEFSVQVIDTDGCTLADTILLSVVIPSRVYMPNIFNPVSSVGNGRFYPQGNYTAPIFFELEIYDRWGSLIFSQKGYEVGDTNSGWDGYSRNQPVNSGVYSYLINLYDEVGQVIDVISGSVTLIR
jgi:gliding motility-associated-like protein